MRRMQMLFPVIIGAVAMLIGSAPVRAQSLQTLATFDGFPDGTGPDGGLVFDNKGNLYGATDEGVLGNDSCDFAGCGTVYQISPSDVVTTLHQFVGPASGGKGADGAYPYYGSLVLDPAGNLYGTTYQGGTYGYGTIFRIAPSGTETILYSFTGGKDGANPYGGLLIHGDALYGTAFAGGSGDGTLFKLSASGFTVLHTFTGSDGASPWSPPIVDSEGNLYGTTSAGGLDYGVVYEFSATGAYSVLYEFKSNPDGAEPRGGLVLNSSGNLYGTTYQGGTEGFGTIFTLTTTGEDESVLASFDIADGANPEAGLTFDSAGNLFGTTSFPGTVFELTKGSTQPTTLWDFEDSGGSCTAPVIFDKAGNLYGTEHLYGGVATDGSAFKLIP
jgi:uncharacterized repeat protein (TIGR03803 family)